MARKTQHVVPNSQGGWSVRKGGSQRITESFETKEKAVHRAKEISKKQSAALIIHRQDGTIQDAISYGSDPCPTKDKN